MKNVSIVISKRNSQVESFLSKTPSFMRDLSRLDTNANIDSRTGLPPVRNLRKKQHNNNELNLEIASLRKSPV